jgi:ribosomal protein S7
MSEKDTNSGMIEKFTNYVMLDGKKSVAIRIMNETFEGIKAK